MPSPLRAGILAPPGGGAPTAYHEFPAPDRLREVVSCSWYGRAGWDRRLRVLPDGCAELVWTGRRLHAVGAVASAIRHPVTSATTSVGIRLRPGVAGAVFGHAADDLPLELLPLDGVGELEERLAEAADVTSQRRLLESFVVRRLENGPEPDWLVVTAARLASLASTVDEVADAVSMSERQLRRRFREHVGYGPKTLHRVLRFQRFVRRIPDLACARTTLATVAAETGYADQSHLGRDCRAVAGSSPRSLVDRWASVTEIFQTPPAGGPQTGRRAENIPFGPHL